MRDIDFNGEGMEYETQYRIEEDDAGPALWVRHDAMPDEYPLGGGVVSPAVEGIVAMMIEAYDAKKNQLDRAKVRLLVQKFEQLSAQSASRWGAFVLEMGGHFIPALHHAVHGSLGTGTVHLLLFGIAFPLGWLDPPTYERTLALVRHPLGRIYLFVLCSLPLFHWAHRFRYTLYDGLQIKHLNEVINTLCYGGAIVGTMAAAYLVWRM